MIDLTKIVVLRDGGSANMGVLTYAPDFTAHFYLDETFVPAFIRLHFAGGSGTADVAVNVDSVNESQFDTLLYTFEERGTGADQNWRVPEDQLMHFIFQAGDHLVLTWTNPDSGNMIWGAEVGLIKVNDLAIP